MGIFASKGDKLIIWSDVAGLVVFIIGFLIEVISDEQLRLHMKDKSPGKEKFIKKGLWRYSRHPNYFGEALLWWGISLIASSLQYGYITVYSALFITVLIRFLSGVPFQERKYAENPEWQQYCKETNIFCLWCYK